MSALRDGIRGSRDGNRVLVLGDPDATAALERAGHVGAPTIDVALEELTNGRFDCLLIDAAGPRGVERLEGAKRLRDESPSLPIVAFCDADAARAASDAGVTDVVRAALGSLSAEELADELDQWNERDGVGRHEAVADLGQRALDGAPLAALTERAVALVAEVLSLERCGAFELMEGSLLLREGVGWESGAVGGLTIDADGGSQAARALSVGEPVVVADLETDDRFDGSDHLASRGVESGISVVVGPPDEPWGVLGAYATDHRTFGDSDVGFVRSVANVLAGAVDRERADGYRLESELEEVYGRVTDAFVALDPDARVTHLNDRAERLLGLPRERLVGTVIWEPFPEAFEETFREDYWEAMERQEPIERERYYPFLDRWYEGRAYPSESGLSVYFRDVTERKRTERQLREERNLKERIIETSPIGITVVDADGRMAFANERAAEVFGHSKEEILARSHDDERWNLVDWDGDPLLAEELPFTRVKRTESPVFDEGVGVDQPDGRRVWLSTNCAPLFDANGEFDGAVYAFEDVTARRRLESELGELLGRVTDGFFGLDAEWRFTFLNERAEELINPEGRDLVGECVWELFPEAIGMAFEEQYRWAMETQQPVAFEEYFEPLGAWFSVRAYPSESGLSVYFSDVSERREHERALREERDLIERLVETSPVGIVTLDADGGFDLINGRAEEILDYPSADLEGFAGSTDAFDPVGPDGEPLTPEEIPTHRVLVGDETFHDVEMGLRPPGRDRVWLSVSGAPLYDEDGTTAGGVITFADVTERREHERELERWMYLQHAVADLGQRAFEVDDLDAFFRETCELVSDVLDAEYCKVLDLDSERQELLIRQGIGFHDGVVGTVSVEVTEETQAGYTLLSEEPIITANIAEETRFSGHDVLRSHDVASGITVLIGSVTDPWGVLGVHDLEERAFTEHDADFVRSVANVLASVIDQIHHERELEGRMRQQHAVADLGQRALEIDDLDALFLEASELVAGVLDNEYCKVLDLDAERRELLLRQGVGWREGIAGSATVAADENSQAGYTLLSKEPVIVDDLDAETRFTGPDLLTSHDVVSGISVIIGSVENPWGILGTHDTERRAFTAYDANFVRSVANVLANAIDRIERERELERYETIVETVNDGIYVIDEAGRFTTVNEAYASMLGYEREELVGEHASVVADDAVIDSAQEIERAMRAGEVETPSLEATLRDRNGERFEVEATFALLSDVDDRDRVGVVRDITERKRIERELRLSAETLHGLYELTSSRELPFEEKLGRVLGAGCERLGLEYGIFTRIEDGTMTIVQSHADHELLQPGASCPLSRSYCRRVLEEDGIVVVDDALEEGWIGDPGYETFELGTYAGGQVVVDGEVYGTICFSSNDPRREPLSEIERTFVELVNGWASYELERTENQRELERQREQLASLDQLNAVIREISHGILESASREEIEAAVCERLAARYQFAWIGSVGRGTNAVVPTAAAGVEEDYLDGIEISLDRDDPRGRGPTAEAIRSREPQFRTNVLEDPAYEPWHEAARERGYRSSAAIPIRHEESLYGVLNVYSPCPEAFGGTERDVLTHLGEVVGHTVYAVEQRKALVSDTVLELEFRLDDTNHPLIEAAWEGDVEITVERLIPGADGAMLQFITVAGMDAATFADAIEQSDPIERVTLLSEDDDGALFELRTSESSLAAALSGFGGRITNAMASDGEFRVIAELPPTVDVRAVVAAVESASGGAELLAQRTETRDLTTRQELRDVLTNRLTEKQRAALETSYFAGYFDWPRGHTGEEVAELLGLSPATLSQHLRIAERKLFDALFAGS